VVFRRTQSKGAGLVQGAASCDFIAFLHSAQDATTSSGYIINISGVISNFNRAWAARKARSTSSGVSPRAKIKPR